MKLCFAFYLAGLLFFSGIPMTQADEASDNDEARLQAVNQDLDNVESKAETAPQNPQPVTRKKIYPDPIISRADDFEVSQEIYWSRFHEPKSFSQRGVMSGYNVRYTHRFTNDRTAAVNMFRVEGQIADGKFKQPYLVGPSGIKDHSYELKGVAGKDFYVTPDVRVTAYSGFGYRYLKDNSEGLNTDLGDDIVLLGYKRYSRYLYLPFGADIIILPDTSYSLVGNLEYDYMFHGWQVDKLGIIPGFDNMTFDQGGGSGLKASLRLNLNFKFCTAFAEGFYRFWFIPKSNSKPTAFDPTISVNEPANSTQEYGFRLGIEI
jgi:hypothetical protein